MEDEIMVVQAPKIENTCKKCLYGLGAVYSTHCAMYKDKKPKEIYWKGQDCPFKRSN